MFNMHKKQYNCTKEKKMTIFELLYISLTLQRFKITDNKLHKLKISFFKRMQIGIDKEIDRLLFFL